VCRTLEKNKVKSITSILQQEDEDDQNQHLAVNKSPPKSAGDLCGVPTRRGYGSCPNYVPDLTTRGFVGSFQTLPGIKIRNESIIGYLFVTLFIGAFVMLAFPTLGDDGRIRMVILVMLAIFFYCIILLKRHKLGRIIAIVTDEALFINAKKINWDEITEVDYKVEMPNLNRSEAQLLKRSRIRIRCKDGHYYSIYHSSYYFYKIIKKYALNAHFCLDKAKTEWLMWYGILIGTIVFGIIMVMSL